MTDWPTPEELEAQQSPFDPSGTYPFEYRIVIVEQIGNDLFEEQLRTYVVKERLDESSPIVPDDCTIRVGRRFRIAADGEAPTMHVINSATTSPIGLVEVA